MAEKQLKVLGFIPARGGSRGVPRKNIRPLLGKSLVQRTFEVARQSPYLDRIVLSTDDEEIAAHGREIGLEVPFLRPAHLATDTTPMIDVIIDVLDQLKEREGYVPDALISLQPTSPLRLVEHIDRAIEVLEDHDAVCSVVPVPLELCPHYVMKINDEGYIDYFLPEGRKITRRQDVIPAYRREGTAYLARVETIYQHRNLYGDRCKPMFVEPQDSISIDNWDDWHTAEQRLTEREP